jgi:predicted dehydrogenase
MTAHAKSTTKVKRGRWNRRRFLTWSAAPALAVVAGGVYVARRRAIRLALVGAGGRGRQLAKALKFSGVRPVYGEIAAVCDVNRRRAEEVQAESCSSAEIYTSFRQVLQRDDILGVLIATPDHWHAAMAAAALDAGKAVYCEKPLTLTVAEGQHLVEAVRRTRGLLLVGTQQRSSRRFQQACELVRAGRLGKIERVDVWLPTGSLPASATCGPFPGSMPPTELDWNEWLGQSPWVEFCKQRYDPFRWWFEYSGGFVTDWGAHHLDIVHWALDVERSGPLAIDGRGELPQIENGYNTPRHFAIDLQYPGGIHVHVEPSETVNGIRFEGERGRIFVNRGRLTGAPVEELARRPLPPDAERLGPAKTHWGPDTYAHLLHFLDCVDEGVAPIADVESQHRAASACHLANISLRLGRKLAWDAERETFIGDAQANAMLCRPRRAGYELKT